MKRQVNSVIENYVCEKLFGKILTLGEIQSKLHGQLPEDVAQQISKSLVGIKEKGGNNCGPLVQAIQDTVGAVEREPWCMSTQQTVEGLVEKWCRVRSSLPVTEHCQTAFVEALKNGYTVTNPKVNDLIIWQKFSAGQPTQQGHVGRIIVDGDDIVTTVEGNTDDGGSRDGDGIYIKNRNLKGYGTSHVRGFIRIKYTAV